MDEEINLPLQIPIQISHHKDQACVILKRMIMEQDLMKQILSCAYNNRSIVVTPYFTNPIHTMNTMVKKGIIYRDKKDGKFYFTF